MLLILLSTFSLSPVPSLIRLPLSVASAFDDAFDLNRGGKVNSDMLVLAHRLLQPLMLRRLKAEVEGKLPPKLETTILCPLSETQVREGEALQTHITLA